MSNKVYRIGEAAKLLEVKTSVLRFWEEEFSQVRPKRTDKDQRYYSEKDIKLLIYIRGLLYDEGMTINGVQKALRKTSFIDIVNTEANKTDITSMENAQKNTQHSFIELVTEPRAEPRAKTAAETAAEAIVKTDIETAIQKRMQLSLDTQDFYKKNIIEIQIELKNLLDLLPYK